MITYVGVARNIPVKGSQVTLMITCEDWDVVASWLNEGILGVINEFRAARSQGYDTSSEVLAFERLRRDLESFRKNYKGEEWCAPDRPGKLPAGMDFMLNIVDSDDA